MEARAERQRKRGSSRDEGADSFPPGSGFPPEVSKPAHNGNPCRLGYKPFRLALRDTKLLLFVKYDKCDRFTLYGSFILFFQDLSAFCVMNYY
jgi:hypothetical protein